MKRLLLLCSVVALSAGQPAHAWEGDTFQPIISYGEYYNSNVFRLPQNGSIVLTQNGVPLLLQGPAADSDQVLEFGAKVDWRPGRQQILLRATKSLVRYSRFSAINYDGSNLLSQWNWRFARRWRGRVGVTQQVAQTSFNYIELPVAVNNLNTDRRAFAGVDWLLDPRWTVGVHTSDSNLLNSSAYEYYLNYNERSLAETLEYRTPKGSSLRTELREADSFYPNQQIVSGSAVDNSYRENTFNVVGTWAPTAKTGITAQVGFLERLNKNIPQRNFSGVISKLTTAYAPTGNTSLSLSMYQQPAGEQLAYASFVLDTGASLNAAWQMTPVFTLQASLMRDQYNYKGDPGIIFGLPHRVDNDEGGAITLVYKPQPMVSLDIGLQAGQQKSTITFYGYRFYSVFANVRLDL
ncbi:MAG: XrtB/PEP-CTERM-associated polysaccharide biosynthesis outer membrane protein EpsL [Acidiferrobacteraceae bacterium]